MPCLSARPGASTPLAQLTLDPMIPNLGRCLLMTTHRQGPTPAPPVSSCLPGLPSQVCVEQRILLPESLFNQEHIV